MKRTMCAACALIISALAASGVYAASAKCTVVKNEGGRIILECGDKAGDFVEGMKIKIKSEKNSAVEGC